MDVLITRCPKVLNFTSSLLLSWKHSLLKDIGSELSQEESKMYLFIFHLGFDVLEKKKKRMGNFSGPLYFGPISQSFYKVQVILQIANL